MGELRAKAEGNLMVKKSGKLFECIECGMKYKNKDWAQKCENWCKEHHTCHIEIIKHAIQEWKKIIVIKIFRCTNVIAQWWPDDVTELNVERWANWEQSFKFLIYHKMIYESGFES